MEAHFLWLANKGSHLTAWQWTTPDNGDEGDAENLSCASNFGAHLSRLVWANFVSQVCAQSKWKGKASKIGLQTKDFVHHSETGPNSIVHLAIITRTFTTTKDGESVIRGKADLQSTKREWETVNVPNGALHSHTATGSEGLNQRTPLGSLGPLSIYSVDSVLVKGSRCQTES